MTSSLGLPLKCSISTIEPYLDRTQTAPIGPNQSKTVPNWTQTRPKTKPNYDFKAMGLLDELKGIVIDQQRAIRERDAKIGTLQQQYDTLNASYWTVLQRLRSYDHIFR